jgi:excinuclease ABC subunit C
MDNKRGNKQIQRFSLADERLYPHLKLTNEKFPRLLVTRKTENDGAEYFGAFLPETGVRFLIDFLNKTFRLRTCEIEIDGQFDVPCTQFYRQRCVAPCVASLCDEKKYNEQVELVRLFLRREQTELEKRFLRIIENYAEDLNYEKAREWRDHWLTVEKIFTAKNWNLWLDDAVDTFEVKETNENFLIFWVTMRGRKTLGKRVFVFPKTGAKEEVLPAILPQLYRFYAPKEIRVSHDFPERRSSSDGLSRRFKRRVKIVVINENNRKIMTERAARRAKFEHDLRQIKPEKSLHEIQTELKKTFNLRKIPLRIESFDVAHISGKDFVAAKSVWENGKFLGKEYEFQFSGKETELEVLQEFISSQFPQNRKFLPDLILIDGGRAHLRAALKGLEKLRCEDFIVASAVKPPRRHGEISHFLTETGEQINFDSDSAAHRVLQVLRDEAHNLSNEIHRQKREMSHYYELAKILPSLDEKERLDLLKKFGSLGKIQQIDENDLLEMTDSRKKYLVLNDLKNFKLRNFMEIEPLIVPLRFDDENGDARNLQPLASHIMKKTEIN